MAQLTMVKAINLALAEAMRGDERVLVLGQDVGVDEGVFRITEGLLREFGPNRCIDTPLAEAAIVGAGIGLAITGFLPVCEMQFDGFSFQAFHQVENHMRRFRNRTRGRYTCPMVLRMPYGGGIRAVEHHSEAPEATYAHLSGLHVVLPSGPRNARALLRTAILSPDPVVYFEPKALYRAFREEVPDEPETLPVGKGVVARPGKDVTIISYGATLRAALEAAEELHDDYEIEAEVLDLLWVAPLDSELISQSVRKTGRAVVAHEAPRHCGVGAEIIARIVEDSLMYLEAPIRRVTGFDTIIPYFSNERAYLPDAGRVVQAALETVNF
ncbi:MAG TPA: alpha-ketoacid dehydrogenase subunit beta [Phycisphaerae bacterium]|jgi:pyruvate dehydrogenase E1 component beta subunit|nr:alpha-ketoacid dehydrogenase subunit beta [Phycisphaerae bacterium]